MMPRMQDAPPLPVAALEPHVRQMVAIAELMLGAAHADGRVTWPERSVMAQILTSFLGHRDLPEAVEARIADFSPQGYDPADSCRNLVLATPEDRVNLLELLSRVADADAVLMNGEASYLKRVALLVGATDEELAPFLNDDQ